MTLPSVPPTVYAVPGRVLPTLNADGTRNRIRPKLYEGRFQRARLIVGWTLITLFVGIPFVKLHRLPLILLDVPHRRFVLFGRTFLPTDGMLLMLLLLSIFVAVIWLTALVGRAWCGWGCPQTVYMEFVYRPIERLFEGGRTGQLRIDRRNSLSVRRMAKNGVFLALSAVLGNVFLSYFVGIDALHRWVLSSPIEHPTPFIVMAVTSALVFFDFAYFREQMCTVICPYARIQSVLLDTRSLIVGYDARRGEPRSHGKAKGDGRGDCIDCNACVNACPTGIDIRNRLQLECIACAQCADACDSIMARVHKPLGLIRYGSQLSLEQGTKGRLLRPRIVIYPALLAVLLGALVVFGRQDTDMDVTVLRGVGAPFVLTEAGVTNQVRIKVENRSERAEAYGIELLGFPEAQLVAPENPLHVAADAHETTSVFVTAPARAFVAGIHDVSFRISDAAGHTRTVPYKLLAPTGDRP